MRRRLVVGNWKMNGSKQQLLSFVSEISEFNFDYCDLVLCPPFVFLDMMGKLLSKTSVYLGAQNCNTEKLGYSTGEVSAKMLKEFDVSYVILGHSERRQDFFEDSSIINQKLKTSIENGISPILCVGESETECLRGFTNEVVEIQTKIGLSGIPEHSLSQVVIAYEPVWSVGTNKIPESRYIEEVAANLRKTLTKSFGSEVANAIRIIYGGSVDEENATSILSAKNLDGLMIGRASLSGLAIAKIIRITKDQS